MKAILPWCVALVLAVGLVVLYTGTKSKEKELAALRQANQELSSARAENDELKKIQVQVQELTRLRKENEELHRLRNEVFGRHRWAHAEHIGAKAWRFPPLSCCFSLANQRSTTGGHQHKALNRGRPETQHKDRVGRVANILMIREHKRTQALLLHRLLQPLVW